MKVANAGTILATMQGHIWSEICLTSKALGIVPTVEEEQDMFTATCVAAMEAFTGKRARFDATKGTALGYVRQIARHRVMDWAKEHWQIHRAPETQQTETETPETMCVKLERSERAITCYLSLSETERPPPYLDLMCGEIVQ